ncbi:polysaccharide lyase family 14 protein [Mycena alexandri]|uniref:Polysaccharide lyase family 14 protein n=1 Tax=Mycena alexandri TaxID=1745969 RepID=A0AAD6RYI7_9AGAR|nr:polysaccharide lyase family 14 protein [Mycena alexandri]KAJ7019416.1 polysaccharide lyase family 14 protein [Mycena alexandri]
MELSHLIPVHAFRSGFTACPSLVLPKIQRVSLKDLDLGVHKVTPRTNHTLVPAPPTEDSDSEWPTPSLAWEAFYPKGSINPSAPIPGGFGFYVSGPTDFATKLQSGATHVILSYRMTLQNDWEWVKGGKLPGIFGGEGDSSYACTGGRQQERSKCFNVRPMWRSKGVGELYTYIPMTPTNRERLLAVPPSSKENADYGFSVGRNAFNLNMAIGKWVSLAFRVKLNSIGSEDGAIFSCPSSYCLSSKFYLGELELWVDGKSVISATGLTLRDSESSRIKGAHFQTFFGGHQDDWASPKDQRAWFADLSGVVIE